MDLDVVFLGTAGSTPTARRAPSAALIRRGGERILLDCGEGTQRQLLRSRIGLVDLDVLLFSHYHADHVLGLPGLLKTYDLRGREQGLELYGPSGLSVLLTVFAPLIGRLGFPLHARELGDGDEVPGDGYRLIAHAVDHRGPAMALELSEDERPGQSTWTRGGPKRARGARLQPARRHVTHGAGGWCARPRRSRAPKVARSSAATRALRGGAPRARRRAARARGEPPEDAERAERATRRPAWKRELVGQRGEAACADAPGARAHPVKDEARAVFANTVVRDFDTIELPLPERGAPELRRGGAHPDEERAP